MSVQGNPQNGGNKKINTAKKGQGNSWIWLMLMANFVFILVLLTVGVMALKVGNVLSVCWLAWYKYDVSAYSFC